MNIDKIKRIVITQDIFTDENGLSSLKNKDIYIYNEDGTSLKEPYDNSIHDNILITYLDKKGIHLADMSNSDRIAALAKAESDGLFERYDSKDIDKIDELDKEHEKNPIVPLEPIPTNEEPDEKDDEKHDEKDDDYENVEADKQLSKRAKAGIAAGVVGAAAIAGTGIAHILKNRDKADDSQKTQVSENEFYELMNQFEQAHPRRVFAESVFETVKAMNLMTSKEDAAVYKTNADGTKEYVFSLKEDVSTAENGQTTNEYLQFTFDEIMAAKLVLNNYSEEDLFKIFGEEQLDSQEIMNQYQKFASKMELYYMNAKAPSGVANLIEEQANKEWFQKLETSIIEFNKNVNQDNADKVIRTFEYLYEYDISGTDNVKVNESSINTIKNLGFHIVTGYYNANAASKDYTKYLTVASAPDEFDRQFQTEFSAQVQKGEKLKDVLSRAKTGKCTMSLVQKQIDESIERLSKQQSETKSADDIKEQYKASLATILVDSGNPELASRVLNETMNDDLRNLIEKEGKEAKNALEAYDNSSSLKNLPSYTEIKQTADKILGPYADLNLTIIMGNRQRGKSLDLGKTSAISDGKKTVVGTTKTTTEKKVPENSLNPSEKKEAATQVEQIKMQDGFDSDGKGNVTVDLTTYNGQGAKAGYTWAGTGEYKYSGTIIDDIDPDKKIVVYSNGSGVLENTFYDIARAAYAYEDVVIDISAKDPSIKAAFDKATTEFINSNKNATADAIKAYQTGWLEGVKTVEDKAIEDGKADRKAEEDKLAAAKAAAAKKTADEANNQEVTTNPESYTASEKPVTDNSNGTYNEDPNQNTKIELPTVEEGEGFHYGSNSYVAIDQSSYNNTQVIEDSTSVPVVGETADYDVASGILDATINELNSDSLESTTSAPVLKR